MVRIVVARMEMFVTSPDTPHLDAVPHLDRHLEKDDEAADEIVRDILQAEPDADAEGAEEEGQAPHVDPHELEYDDQRDGESKVMRQGCHGDADAELHVALGHEPVDDQPIEIRGEDSQENEDG